MLTATSRQKCAVTDPRATSAGNTLTQYKSMAHRGSGRVTSIKMYIPINHRSKLLRSLLAPQKHSSVILSHLFAVSRVFLTTVSLFFTLSNCLTAIRNIQSTVMSRCIISLTTAAMSALSPSQITSSPPLRKIHRRRTVPRRGGRGQCRWRLPRRRIGFSPAGPSAGGSWRTP